MGRSVYAIATMDTKGHELAFVADCLRAAGVAVVTVDVGTKERPAVDPDFSRNRVIECHAAEEGRLVATGQVDRGRAITAMSHALDCFIRREFEAGRVAGVIGIGGSGGTALITPALRSLPIGVPKIMVSTLASGNTAPFVGTSDITMIYPVVDVAGLNAVSRRVLANAAHAMAGMVQHETVQSNQKPTLGLTMFGVTTPCVTMAREALEALGFDCLVFHATGIGGQAMEKLVAAGLIEGVLDVTTTEVADHVIGGILPCGPDRFDVILQAKVPFVISLGALDMVNFGEPSTVPERLRDRLFHRHNPQVTLMRTTPQENRECARWIAAKLNRAVGPFAVLIPEKGISAIDAPGQPFFDPEADAALFDELESAIQWNADRRLVRIPLHINEPQFARTLVESFLSQYRFAGRVLPVPASSDEGTR
jgi:uncharacterized protein (UPF0261 family)